MYTEKSKVSIVFVVKNLIKLFTEMAKGFILSSVAFYRLSSDSFINTNSNLIFTSV